MKKKKGCWNSFRDRYSRKLMIILGVTLWSLTTVAGSFVPKDVKIFSLFL
jgi:hypothetical protein